MRLLFAHSSVKGTLANAFVPLMCGTAFKNKGVQPLLDAVVTISHLQLNFQTSKEVTLMTQKGNEP